jgi:hypothetical protein
VLLDRRVRACSEPDVIGVSGTAGEHLLAVDDVVVAVAHSGRAQRCQIASGRGLGVTDRELDGACQDCRQELLLLFLGAGVRERRPDGVQRYERDGCIHPLRLLEEDELLERGESASAVFFGPTDAEQPGFSERAHALLDGIPALHAPRHGSDAFGRHHRLERSANLGAQLLLLGSEVQMHGSGLGSEANGHPLDARHHGRPHSVDIADQLEFRIATQEHLEQHTSLESGQL